MLCSFQSTGAPSGIVPVPVPDAAPRRHAAYSASISNRALHQNSVSLASFVRAASFFSSDSFQFPESNASRSLRLQSRSESSREQKAPRFLRWFKMWSGVLPNTQSATATVDAPTAVSKRTPSSTSIDATGPPRSHRMWRGQKPEASRRTAVSGLASSSAEITPPEARCPQATCRGNLPESLPMAMDSCSVSKSFVTTTGGGLLATAQWRTVSPVEGSIIEASDGWVSHRTSRADQSEDLARLQSGVGVAVVIAVVLSFSS
mmetsp:Transcript_17879/g.49522  ORF Transcript_17879/g.49522 Transcript_17879/m.49522 type:complete len:261 (-) Transcript_17879:48-830(-)